ncbi:glycoside hydrolase family 13 protein [Clostridium sardiniense]|uniref:glycoside hydrolase family 13 protein n=1 Tax=Clostridium sardiniense TaxID=29369 RepID=UPI00195A7B5D|nr:glycoside hydrolase family 13 protein [Clostridium sardiniense]MBM7832997.1 glycosidase [Clostridium sardiniense]
MNKQAIYHIPDVPYAYAIDKDTLRITLRVAKDDIKEVKLYYRCRYDFKSPYETVKMNLFEDNNLIEIYSADIKVFRNRYRYYFEITDLEGKIHYYDERGYRENIGNKEADLIPFQYAYIGEADVYEESKWLQEAVVYQIFPDRFCNGNKENDPKGIKKWGDKVDTKSIFGGDLKGIINKIDYLKDLGVNLIYMTPIFMSPSNHKYNINDYYKIDPQFGDKEDLKNLVKKAHENGIKVILDGVFNHTGDEFFAFKDILRNGKDSEYRDWYHIDKLPIDQDKVNYYTFANDVKNMPKLNTNNEKVRKYFIDVAKYWIKEVDIDGWRFDVCDEVDHRFWREMRVGIKEVKRDAVLIGEIMHEAVSFLRGEQLDSIMNYPFKHAMVDFFAKGTIDAKELNDALSMNRYIYMESITRQLWNLFGSHDTARFLTECKNDIQKMKLAIAFQFTYLGVPYIYYGDEVGIDGGDDPQCRKCMPWEEENQNKEVLDHYKDLIKIRKENKSLIHGDYKCLHEEGNVISFRRRLYDEETIVIINNDEKISEISLNIKGNYIDMCNNITINCNDKIIVKPLSYIILKKK